MKKLMATILALVLMLAFVTGCGKKEQPEPATQEPEVEVKEEEPKEEEQEAVELLVAAAASLEYSFKDELIPLFEEQHKGITVKGTYDSSGKLQAQIEEGLEADVFMSAAPKQMKALDEQTLMDSDSITDLLENKIVLIVPADGDAKVTSFEDINKAESIALGDPESVPVGQYSQQALTNLGVWDEIQPKVSFGTNVTQVLNWVAEGSADCGIVYATDAATTDKVTVLGEAPEGSLDSKVIYPVGVVASSANPKEAQLFVDFLGSPEAIAIFEKYGFVKA